MLIAGLLARAGALRPCGLFPSVTALIFCEPIAPFKSKVKQLMRAIAINEFGGPDVFTEIEMPTPTAGEGQVVIAVKASAVNPVDYKVRDGRGAFLCPEFPAILHADCAGVISEVGEGVGGFAVGDEVYAFSSGLMGKPGALAEFMLADARMIALKPKNLSFEEAAALPLVTVTAWYSLYDCFEIGPQHTILVQGGTGGVGHVGLQLAKARGAKVYATCGSDEKCEIAKSLGADDAFNYKTMKTKQMVKQATGGAGFDVVYNTPGMDSIDQSVVATAYRGTILDILGDFPTQPGFSMKWLNFSSVFAGRSITHDVDQEHVGEILRETAKLVEAGKLRPLVHDKTFTFAEAGAAHEEAEHAAPTGKVVLSSHW
jgi:NADPH2:quinone reductase